MFGWSAEEVLGKRIPELPWVYDADVERVAALGREMAAGRQMRNVHTNRNYRKDGSVVECEWYNSALLDSSGKLVSVRSQVLDVTERKEAKEQIEALNRHLQQRAKELEVANKELESFSYSVSHDLRTPLASIGSFSRLLLEDYGAHVPEECQRYLGLILSNTQEMEELVTSLLALARLSRLALKKERVNMTALVREALDTLQREAQRSDLTIDLKNLPEAEADPLLLKQVWVNLIANAFKFTRKCGDARIEIGCGPRDGADRVYYVRDNGVGFDMEQASRLFVVFQRLHGEEEYEGTGVGLAIVARIVHRHGGRVWAEAKAGEGATFYFTLG
jgi:PAS domain S-box-containing protein